MKPISITIAFLAICAGAMPAFAVNKCTLPDGKVAFQDAPCAAGKAEALNIRPSAGTAPATTPAAMSAAKRSELDSAILAGRPAIGMTRAELERALGAPTLVNANNYGGKLKDQIIFERPGQQWLVYTENGIVTDIQNRPSIASSAPQKPAVVCPSALEIRNMETSASSVTIPESVRVEMLRQIRDAKQCGK